MQINNLSTEVGDSFEIRNDLGIHLHVVVAEASPDASASIFLVYISSQNIPAKDPTTIINIGEHPYITKESWVRHQNVIICSRQDIQQNIVSHYGKVSPELLERIQYGIENSKRVNDYQKTIFREWKTDRLYREMKK